MTVVTLSLGLSGLVVVINIEIFHLQGQKYGNNTATALNLSPSKTFQRFIVVKILPSLGIIEGFVKQYYSYQN